MFNKNYYIINMRRLFFGEGDEKGVIEFWSHKVDVEEAVRFLRGELVNLQELLSGHHGTKLLQKGF